MCHTNGELPKSKTQVLANAPLKSPPVDPREGQQIGEHRVMVVQGSVGPVEDVMQDFKVTMEMEMQTVMQVKRERVATTSCPLQFES